MSQYTTGEVAAICGVSVRTVQYYDTRGILVPNQLSEGGRRLYSDDDLGKMRVICFLRGVGLSIDNIASILVEDNSAKVIRVLLERQIELLHEEIAERREKLSVATQLMHEIADLKALTVEKIGDIAFTMENQKGLRRVHAIILTVGIILDAIQIAVILIWIFKGLWIPFVVGMAGVIGAAFWIIRFYYRNTAYICPECHEVFKPRLKEFFFAAHTLKTRKLTCAKCAHKGFCIETYDAHKK